VNNIIRYRKMSLWGLHSWVQGSYP